MASRNRREEHPGEETHQNGVGSSDTRNGGPEEDLSGDPVSRNGSGALPAGAFSRAGLGASDAEAPPDPLERAMRNALKGAGNYGSNSDPAQRRWPSLWALLSRLRTPGKKMREPSSIGIRLTKNGAQATLSDFTISHSLTVEAETLDGLWDALEAEIVSDSPRWKPMKRGELYNRKRSDDSKKPDEFGLLDS